MKMAGKCGMAPISTALALLFAVGGCRTAAAGEARIATLARADIDIPAGVTPVIDGVIAAGEWDDAVRVTIQAPAGREVHVRVKHDGQQLHAAFSGLIVDGVELYPELLVGTVPASSEWQPTDHWFHASYRNCDSSGRPNDYSTCAPTRPGWVANNFPLTGDVVEMSIAFPRVAPAGPGREIMIAFNVTDTRAHWSFWPAAGTLDTPAGWARAVLR